VINAAADTAYRVAVGGHTLTVTHADGYPVVPVDVDAFLIGMGERYDVTLTVASGTWPIIAVAEGKDARAGAILRTSDTTAAGTVRFEASELDGKWLRYADLAAHDRARLEPPSDVTTIEMSLTGGMMMTDWGIDGRRYGEHEPATVEAGRWYALAITNATTMWHPIHLHGHTPQVGRIAGGVRKDTINILPGVTTELVFQADNPGQWMLHCHNAYHLEAGMATLVRYAVGDD
jgi:FtsP/CotA-like multicopper oxidase with cupredoxin domain